MDLKFEKSATSSLLATICDAHFILDSVRRGGGGWVFDESWLVNRGPHGSGTLMRNKALIAGLIKGTTMVNNPLALFVMGVPYMGVG